METTTEKMIDLLNELADVTKAPVIPHNAGLHSTPSHVGTRLSRLLNSLGDCLPTGLGSVADGPMVEAIDTFRLVLHTRLQEAGWRINTDHNDNWRVLPPKN